MATPAELRQQHRERVLRIVGAYRRGATMQQIADRHGITRQRVSQIVQDFELKRLRARGRSRARSYLAAADLVVLCDWIDRRGGGEAFTEFARRH